MVNRISSEIDRLQKRIDGFSDKGKLRGLEKTIEKLEGADILEMQTIKTLGQSHDLITLEEANHLYEIINDWDNCNLASKIVACDCIKYIMESLNLVEG